jgi:spermidine synthase
MIGLTMGSLFINRILEKIQDPRPLYIKTQFYISMYPLLLALICTGLAKINEMRPDIGNNLQLVFAFLPIIAGFLGGFQFPLAGKICLTDINRAGKIVGFLYGIDLFGSCMGGLLAGVFLMPILGIIQTCVLLCIVNFSALLLLASNR